MTSKKIRSSARGQQCTLNIAGVCNHNAETVVYAHLPDESNGMGKKSDDISGCYACSDCHDVIDRRGSAWRNISDVDREFYMRRAMVRTWRILIENGIVVII